MSLKWRSQRAKIGKKPFSVGFSFFSAAENSLTKLWIGLYNPEFSACNSIGSCAGTAVWATNDDLAAADLGTINSVDFTSSKFYTAQFQSGTNNEIIGVIGSDDADYISEYSC